MNKIKKVLILLSSSFLIFLAACDLKRIVDLEINILDDKLVMYEGDDLPFDKFELIAVFNDGSKKEIDGTYKGLYYKIRSLMGFNHLDPNDDERVELLVFGIGNKDLAETEITIKRRKVRDIQLISYGNTDYLYGDLFDLSGFKLIVSYVEGNNELLDLTRDMVQLPSLKLQPETLGTYDIEVYYNGFKMSYPISVFVSKGNQTLQESLVKLQTFTRTEISVKPIEGAEYAFFPTGSEPAELIFQDSPVFTKNDEVDYTVVVRLAETDYLEASNTITKEFSYTPLTKQPNLLFTGTTWLLFEYDQRFDLVLVDEFGDEVLDEHGQRVELETEISGSTIRVSNLLPNHTYRFAHQEKGSSNIYPQNIYPLDITTKAITDIILRPKVNQTAIYNSEVLGVSYTVLQDYADLIEVYVTYLQDGVEVTPFHVGLYQYEIRNNFSNEVLTGTFEITKRDLTINVENKTKVYDEIDPEFTLNLNDSLDDLETFTYSITRVLGENVGNYPINATVSHPDYRITVIPGILDIKKREITVTLHNQEITYGELDVELTYELTEEAYRNEINLNVLREEGYKAGTYRITATSENLNFDLTIIDAQYIITPRALTVQLEDKSKIYDTEEPVFTSIITNAVEGDTFEILYSRTVGENVGLYEITASVEHEDYIITVVPGTLTINPRPITATLHSKTITYEDANLPLTYELSDEDYREQLSLVISRELGNDAGTYLITATSLNNNFDLEVIDATYTIQPKDLTVTILNKTKVYGDLDPALTLDLGGALDNLERFNVNIARTLGEDVDTYEITGTVTNPNYNITLVDGLFTITKRNLTVEVVNKTKTYGDTDPSFELNLNDALDDLDAFEVTYSRTQGETVGQYTITALVLNNNYEITVVDGTLTINKYQVSINYTYPLTNLTYGDLYEITADATLAFNDTIVLSNHEAKNVGTYTVQTTIIDENLNDVTSNYELLVDAPTYTIVAKDIIVSATPLSYVYGTTVIPTREFEVTGLQYGEQVDDVIFGNLAITSFNGVVGTYTITQGTLSTNNNYTLTFIGSTLSIFKRDLTIAYSGDLDVIYGDTFNVMPHVSEGSLVFDHELRLVGTSGIKDVATYDVETRVFNSNNEDVTSNYELHNHEFTYTVNKKVLTVTFASASRYVGQTNDKILYTLNVNGFAYGENDLVLGNRNGIVVQTNAVKDDLAGTYDIWVTTGYTSDNYDFNYITGELVIDQISLIFDFENVTVIYNGANQYVDLSTLIISDPVTEEILDTVDYLDLLHVTYEQEGVAVTPFHIGTYNVVITFEGNDVYEEAVHRGNTLRIDPKPINVYAVNSTKTYGDSDPVLELDLSEAYVQDTLTTSVSRVQGENVGTYAITATASHPDYLITVVPGIFEITKRDLTITVHSQSKIYGELDPALTYTVTNARLGDNIVPTISRAEGNNVGTYAITATYTNNNYNITIHHAELEIIQRELTITVDSKTKTYGELDPTFTYQVDNAASTDTITPTISRVQGENVGTYAITATFEDANYDITIHHAELEIIQRELTITVDSKSKTYGELDPTFTYQVDNAASTDTITPTLSRVLGENVGTYAITASYSNSNYDITIINNQLEITKRAITITVDAKTKTYGELDPVLTVTITNALLTDSFDIEYSREAGENVGTYVISIDVEHSNYEITTVSGELVITQREITITLDNQTQVYGNESVPFTYTTTDALHTTYINLVLSRVSGNNVGTYAITGSYSNDNYDVTIIPATYTITPRPITATMDNQTSVYGDGLEDLTYTLSEEDYRGELGLVPSKANGLNAGTYEITASTTNPNFTLTVVKGTYTITKRDVTVTIGNNVKYWGDSDPTEYDITYSIFVEDGQISFTYSRTNTSEEVGSYAVNGTATSQNYNVTVIAGSLQILKTAVTINGTSEINELPVVEINYNDNSIKNATFGGVIVKNESGTDITNLVTVTYPNGTNLLANGATTLIANVSVTGTSNVYGTSQNVIYKYKSVQIGNNFYTIEDALLNTTTGTRTVKFNTTFASSDVALLVYNATTFNLRSDSTLLLPYDATDNGTNLQTNNGDGAAGITRNAAFVKLYLQETTILNVYGTLTLNAKLSAGTPHAGYVSGNFYSELHMPINSKMNIYGGTLNANGFIVGEGTIEAINNGKVYERLFVMAFRGGSITSAIYNQTFPFDQYTLNNIEVPLTINRGSQLYARVMMYVQGWYTSDLLFIANTGSLINLDSADAKIVKSYDVTTGKTTFDLYGETKMQDVTITLAVTAKTENKDFPLPANIIINIKDGGKFTLDMRAKLLPGSVVHIEEGAEAVITNKGSLMVYDADEYYPGASQTYYNSNAYGKYRVQPTSLDYYKLTNPAQLINDGKITVENSGKIAGKITSSQDNYGTNKGIIEIKASALTALTVKSFNYSTGSTFFTTAYYDEIAYQLKDKVGNIMNIKGVYQIHGDSNPWTTDITFINPDGVPTVVTQTALANYILPEWFDEETMSIFTTASAGVNLDSLFALGTVANIQYSTVYVRLSVKHQVSFETNGGTPMDDIMILDGTSFNPNIDYVPTKPGNLFRGWYLDSSLTTKYTNQVILSDLTLYANWLEGEPIITISASNTNPDNNANVTITATVKSQNDIDLEGVTVTFTKDLSDGTLTPTQAVTGANGQAQTTFSGPGANTYNITATESLTGKSTSVSIKVKAAEAGGSPWLFSENGTGYATFEHEPVSLKLLKSVEGSSFGTLRLLEAQDGMYYIQVVEKGTSVTVLDHVELYAVDYLDDGSVLDFFYDIYGNPHTVRQQLRPVTFTDHNGKDLLQEVLMKDSVFAQADQLDPQTLTYFTATFDRPVMTDTAKLMVSVKDKGETQNLLHALYDSFNAQQNLWWLDQAFMGSEITRQWIDNVFKAMEVKVEVWNGTEWVRQASVELGTYLMESFLIPIDLTGLTENQVKVRFVSPSRAGYQFDDVSIDYTENLPFIVRTLQPQTAIKNGTIDVLDLVAHHDNAYVELPTYNEGVRIGFNAVDEIAGLTRAYGVKMSGFIYNSHAKVTDPLQPLTEGKTFEEIKQIIIDSGRQELIDDIPLVEEFYYTIMYIGSQDYETLLYLLLDSMLDFREE